MSVWLPVENYASSQRLDRAARQFLAVGRLKPESSVEQAAANMTTLHSSLASLHPKENTGYGVSLIRFHDFLTEGQKSTLWILLGAVGLLLLACCTNVANLLAARATQQERELAVRAALGATRGRLARQLLTDGVVLAMLGGGVGMVIAAWAIRAIPAITPAGMWINDGPSLNPTVLGFNILLAGAAGVLAALVPSRTASRIALQRAFQENSPGTTSARGGRARDVLVVLEIAISLVLLVGSGLLLRSLYRLLTVDLGFSADRVLTMEYRLHRKYKSRDEQWGFHRRVVEATQAIPGVRVAALARAAPFSGNGGTVTFATPSGAALRDGERPIAVFNTVTGGYFDALRIPLLAGRSCGDHDTDRAPTVVIVNDKLAQRLWPQGNAVGQTLEIADWGVASVIGIVGGNRQNNIRREPPWQLYACYGQNPGTLAAIVMHTHGDTASIAAAAKQAVWSIDGEQAVWKIRTLNDMVEAQTSQHRLVATLVLSFAAVAIALAVIGVYGIVSYTVTRRTREIGIRLALGARGDTVLRVVLGRVLVLTAAGAVLGLAASLAAGQALVSVLYQMEPKDPATLAACAGLLMLAAVAAAVIPARKALRTDPVAALRHE